MKLIVTILILFLTGCNHPLQNKDKNMAQVGNLSIAISYSGLSPNKGTLSDVLSGYGDYGCMYFSTVSTTQTYSATYTYTISLPAQYVHHLDISLYSDSFLISKPSSIPQNHYYKVIATKDNNEQILIKEEIFTNISGFFSDTLVIDENIKNIKIIQSATASGRNPTIQLGLKRIQMYNSTDSSGLIVKGTKNQAWDIAQSEQHFITPLRIQKSKGIYSITLVRPSSPIATPVRLQLDPKSPFVKSLLGENNNGVVALGGRKIS